MTSRDASARVRLREVTWTLFAPSLVGKMVRPRHTLVVAAAWSHAAACSAPASCRLATHLRALHGCTLPTRAAHSRVLPHTALAAEGDYGDQGLPADCSAEGRPLCVPGRRSLSLAPKLHSAPAAVQLRSGPLPPLLRSACASALPLWLGASAGRCGQCSVLQGLGFHLPHSVTAHLPHPVALLLLLHGADSFSLVSFATRSREDQEEQGGHQVQGPVQPLPVHTHSQGRRQG